MRFASSSNAWPILRPALVSAAILVFVDTMKELPATILLRPFNFETLATLVYNQASLEAFEDAAPAAEDNRDLAPVPANRPPSLQQQNDGSGMRTYNRYGQQPYQPSQQGNAVSSGVRPSTFNRPVMPRPRWSTSQSGSQPARSTPPAIPDWDRGEQWQHDLRQQLDSLSDTTASLERKPVATRWQAIPIRQASKERAEPASRRQAPSRDGWRSAL